jgi:hypothetical protein
MADNTNNTQSFIIGGLVIVVAVMAYLYYTGNFPGQETNKASISIEMPSAPKK